MTDQTSLSIPIGARVYTTVPMYGIPAGAVGIIARAFPANQMYYVEFQSVRVKRVVPADQLEAAVSSAASADASQGGSTG